MTPLASIQPILAVEHHSNADLLDIVTVMGYRAIVKRDQWKVGDLCAFIEPDSVLPDQPWATFYKARSNRIKAIRLRPTTRLPSAMSRWPRGLSVKRKTR